MSKTVFLIGAGLSRGLTDSQGLMPPLDNDFFQMLAKKHQSLPGEYIPRGNTIPHYKFRIDQEVPPYSQASDPGNIYWIYGLIQTIWHMSPIDLANKPFSLEEFITFLQLDRQEAIKIKNKQKSDTNYFVELVLEHRLLSYLKDFSRLALEDVSLLKLARLILAENSTVITTNYDLILESVIEKSSAETNKTFNIAFSKWNPKFAYAIRFSQKDSFNSSSINRPLFLKLHGSLNWSSISNTGTTNPKPENGLLLYNERQLHAYLELGHSMLYIPLIVPMTLYKQKYYLHPAITSVWRNALRELSECENLIVIGYSFPPTDFHVKKLFLDSFVGHELKNLTVINPDNSVVEKIKLLTNYRKPVKICRDITEYC
jgi:hypothetical protein